MGEKTKRGGFREAARGKVGAKPKENKRVQLSCTVAPETMEKIKSKANGKSIGKVIDSLFLQT